VQQAQLEAVLWASVRANPCKPLTMHCLFLKQHGFKVQTQFIARIFTRWAWAWKKLIQRQIEKYSKKNVGKYLDYLLGIDDVPYERIKFVDEAHFVSKDLHNRRAMGEVGEPVFVVTSSKLDLSYSLTLMTSLSDPARPCIIDLRTNSNTQWDFASFIMFCLQSGHLSAGDFLVLDNARYVHLLTFLTHSIHRSVHVGMESTDLILTACRLAGVQLRFLPAYSPELNPCEFVFAACKKDMRMHRSDNRMWLEMLLALSRVNPEKMRNMYRHCISGWRNNLTLSQN
jgi:transposase